MRYNTHYSPEFLNDLDNIADYMRVLFPCLKNNRPNDDDDSDS